jgi:hypothetical protein
MAPARVQSPGAKCESEGRDMAKIAAIRDAAVA